MQPQAERPATVDGDRSVSPSSAQPTHPARVQLKALSPYGYDAQLRSLAPVQAKGAASGDVHAAAAKGVSGSGSALPHADTIQASFGRHDISHVQAYGGSAAQAACADMGATAYATGDKVAHSGSLDLHTAAHEAAHVVQQKAGVQLAGGVGRAGDAYEQHADAVADLVVQGKSAEALLDASPSGGGSGVQHKAVQMANVNVNKKGVITSVTKFRSRPASNVRGSQGDHTTAYTTFESMINSHTRGKTPEEACKALIKLLGDFHLLPGMATKTAEDYNLPNAIKKAQKELAESDADPKVMGAIIDDILEIRNYVPLTSMRVGKSSGGHGESKFAGELDTLEDKFRTGADLSSYSEDGLGHQAVTNMWQLFDYDPNKSEDDDKIVAVLVQHLTSMYLAYPEVYAWCTAKGYWLVPWMVKNVGDRHFCKKLDDKRVAKLLEAAGKQLG